MITLFHIPPHQVDTSKFKNLLHDDVVTKFEHEFCDYVGALHGVAVNSATSGIFLSLKLVDKIFGKRLLSIPAMIPPVVLNAVITAGWEFELVDDTTWVGNAYTLLQTSGFRMIDSAQQVTKDQLANRMNYSDLTIYSFYPTKPVASCDGGMIVSNNKKYIDTLREMSMNGMTYAENNWDRHQNRIGYKMYMNSIQAAIALDSLHTLPERKKRLGAIRNYYNTQLGMDNTSHHLYRIYVDGGNDVFVAKALEAGIQCGIHYRNARSVKCLAEKEKVRDHDLHGTTQCSQDTVSIPYHANLTDEELHTVVEFVKNYA